MLKQYTHPGITIVRLDNDIITDSGNLYLGNPLTEEDPEVEGDAPFRRGCW